MKKPGSVEEYLDNYSEWADILIPLREILLSTGMQEQIKWMFPCYSDRGKNIASIGATKHYVGIWFFQGSLLEDGDNLLINAQEGKTKAMRQWRINSIDDLDKDKLEAYLYEAIENQRAGREIKADRSKLVSVLIPAELEEAFLESPDLRAKFELFSPGKKRDYAEHIGEAKRVETRKKRLEKSIPMIMAGIGLNDKYIRKR